jgi:hypothetical protein
MNLEKQKEIQELVAIYYPNNTDSALIGMCQAMLTDEQADTMISYLEKWIGEKNA